MGFIAGMKALDSGKEAPLLGDRGPGPSRTERHTHTTPLGQPGRCRQDAVHVHSIRLPRWAPTAILLNVKVLSIHRWGNPSLRGRNPPRATQQAVAR